MLSMLAAAGLGMLVAAVLGVLAYVRFEERSGSLTATTAVALTTRYATASASDYQAANGEVLLGIRGVFAPDGAAVGGAACKLRIFGGAVGEDILLTLAGSGGTLATTGIATSEVAVIPIGRALKSGNLSLEALMTVDMGTAQVSVTMYIQTADGSVEQRTTVMPSSSLLM
jgi:hypothetical protein